MTGMDEAPLTARRLWFTRAGQREWLMIELMDGRAVGMPVSAFPTLARAGTAQRAGYRKIGRGVGFNWPTLDLDLSVDGIVAGLGERRSARAQRRAA